VGLHAASWSDNERKTGSTAVAESDFEAESVDLMAIGGGGVGCSLDEFGVAPGPAMFWELVTAGVGAGVEAGKTTTRGVADWPGGSTTSCAVVTEAEGEGEACGASSVFSWFAECLTW